jgi:UDP-GlcNAc:undecaprenyl-phosphate GlcNAc-1-phosphate transferase
MEIAEILQLIFFMAGGILAAYICNLLLLRFSESLGIRNKNDVTIRWSNQSKPSLGGVSFFVVFVFFSIAYSVTAYEENIFQNQKYIGLFVSGTLAFIMGLSDDAYNTKPLLKLFAQISCGIILVYTNSVIRITGIEFFDYVATVFWVVLLMNSLNMLDNMDGITGTVVLFIIITCVGSNYLLIGSNVNVWTTLNYAMIGGLIGFLYFNINPSKLFMGDAGSQFIGLFIAFITIDNLWMAGINNGFGSEVGLLLIIICFTAPFSDTLTVFINRLRKGQSPMIGGKDHTTHHLVYSGLNDKQVWYVFLLISIISCLFTLLMIYLLKSGYKTLLFFFPLYSLLTFIILYRNTHRYKQK